MILSKFRLLPIRAYLMAVRAIETVAPIKSEKFKLQSEIARLGITGFEMDSDYLCMSLANGRRLALHIVALGYGVRSANYYRQFFYFASLAVIHYKYPGAIPSLCPPYAPRKSFGRFLQCNIDEIIRENLTDETEIRKMCDLFHDRLALKSDSLFIDGGCWTGLGSVRAAEFIKTGHIIAIEADPVVHAVVKKNLAINDLDAVEVHHAAVYETTGTIPFFTEESGSQKSGGGIPSSLVADGPKDPAKDRATNEIKCFAIDDLAIKDGAAAYRHVLCSLTVNGAELNALKGMRKMLSLDIPIGIHAMCRDDAVFEEMKAYLEAANMVVFRGSNYRVLAVK